MTTAAETELDRAALLFQALSDPTRLAALDLLRGGEKCVCELQDQLDVAQSRLSFHLKVLKDAGFVQDRKEGRWSYYTIDSEALDEAHDFVIAFLPRNMGSGRSQSFKAASRSKPACCR